MTDTPTPTTTTHLALDGLHCAGCASATERALRAVPGVTEASVDLLSATIEHDTLRASVDDLVRAVEEEGFTATLL